MAKLAYRTRRVVMALIVTLSLCIASLFSPTFSVVAYAAEGDTYLAFTSDVHQHARSLEPDSATVRLDAWIDMVEGKFGPLSYMGFCGDMGPGYWGCETELFWDCTQLIMNVVENKGFPVCYTTGNHEFIPGDVVYDSATNTLISPTRQELASKYTVGAAPANVPADAAYQIYCLGCVVGYQYGNQPYTDGQRDRLAAYLQAADSSKPIIVMAHYPLHATSNRTTLNSAAIADTLNNAATNGTPDDTSDDKTIVFLWGHNHTDAPVTEPNYDRIYSPGSVLPCADANGVKGNKTFAFYYAAAGCMSDTEYNNSTLANGSASVRGKGLVIRISPDGGIGFGYLNAEGNDVTKDGDYPRIVPETPTTYRYVETDELKDGGEYIIAADNVNGGVDSLQCNNGDVISVPFTVTAGEGDDPDCILTGDDGVAWAYASDTEYLTSGDGFLLQASGGALITEDVGGHIAKYENLDGAGILAFDAADGLGSCFVTHDDNSGSFATSNDSGDAATIRLFEKQESPLYTVKWTDASGYVLQTGKCAAGEIPAYTGETPVRYQFNEYAYDFVGWSPAVTAVTGPTTYTATFSERIVKHFVSFSAGEGSGQMSAVEVVHGKNYKLPACGYKAPDGKVFSRWDKGVVGGTIKVTSNMTIKAMWAKDKWNRIWGSNGYDTMQAIVDAEGGFTIKNTDTIVIASRSGWEDPLAATALAGVYNAPLLLAGKANEALPAQTMNEIERLRPKTIFVIGDKKVVGDTALKSIKSAAGPGCTVKRIGSGNYLNRANSILASTNGWSGGTAIIATHNSFRDTLSASPVAYKKKFPILFVGDKKSKTEGGVLANTTINLLKSKGIKKVIIVGGNIAVSPKVETQLKAKGITTTRWYGQSSLDTSATIAKNAISQFGMTVTYLSVARSDGNNYVDALAGAALTGRLNSVLVLVNSKQKIGVGTKAFDALKSRLSGRLSRGYVYGGTAAVSAEYFEYFRQYQ